MTPCSEKPDTIERARVMGLFIDACRARGLKVGLALCKHPDESRGNELVDVLKLTVRSTDPSETVQTMLGEFVWGDIRDTIRLVALQIGIRPKVV